MDLTERTPAGQRIEKQLVGEPITVGERTIQPVARVDGWRGSQQTETGGGGGAWLRIAPVEVIVRERDGSEYQVPISDPTREALRGIRLAGLLIAGLCWLLMLVLKFRKSKRSLTEEVQT